tara:strand:- start:229 stop:507 length:279 start_codon:yes stop_codon:yes gene_type:complete
MKKGVSYSFSWVTFIKSSWFYNLKLYSQHEGRVGIIGFSESVINCRHPGLVSGSLLILGGSIMGNVWQNEVIFLENCALIFCSFTNPEGMTL